MTDTSEVIQVAYLMEAGWSLYVSPRSTEIMKSETVGDITTVKRLDVSVDAVIELEQSGRIEQVAAIGDTFIYKYAKKEARET